MPTKKSQIKVDHRIKNKPISFGIVRIELVDKNISSDFEPKNNDNIKFKASVDLSSDNDKSYLLVKISCSFLLDDESEILSFIVHNEYHIKDLKSYIVNKKFIDKGFIQYIADLSFNHTRGIQATIINNTKLSKMYIPIIRLDKISDEPIEQA